MQEAMLLDAWQTARQDLAKACLMFGMRREFAARLAAASAPEVSRMSSCLGSEPIFVVRQDCERILMAQENTRALQAAAVVPQSGM